VKKRPLHELINREEHAWTKVAGWIREGRNHSEILEARQEDADNTLYELQVTTRSPMGAVAYETGGILVDNGWRRIRGSMHERMGGDLLCWNGLGKNPVGNPLQGELVVAHDAAGGFFAVNGGAFPGERGIVFYHAMDTLEWEDLQTGYTGFLQWVADGDLAQFYGSMRWEGWKEDVRALHASRGVHFYPPLWAKEGGVTVSSRSDVPMIKLWGLAGPHYAEH